MTPSPLPTGETFPAQFVWQLPHGDYLRAVFEAEVIEVLPAAEKYVVRLRSLIAGRQETAAGLMQPREKFTQSYWALVSQLIGNKVTLAYEAQDGRPLHMRLETLTGEHNFFTRFQQSEGDEAA